MHQLTATFLLFCALSISVAAGDLTESTQRALRNSPSATLRTWTEFHDDYTTTASAKDGDAKWSELEAYANAFWEIEKAITPGQSISDYPGILSHGSIKWDDATNRYVITLGLRPFSPRDGLGQFTVAFDLTGRIHSKERRQYLW